MVDFLDALRRRVGDFANSNRLGVRRRFGGETHHRRVGFRLSDLRRVQLGDAHEPRGFLALRFRLHDERGVAGLGLLQLALLIRDRALGIELCFFRAARLRRGDDFGVGLCFGRGLAPARFGDLRLYRLDVQRIEDQSEIGQLARAGLADDHREWIVLVLERLPFRRSQSRRRVTHWSDGGR